MRRHDNIPTYKISTARGIYAVTMQRLNNTVNGGPRYRAFVITLSVNGEQEPAEDLHTVHYTFSGGYNAERAEAEKVVRYHENKYFA